MMEPADLWRIAGAFIGSALAFLAVWPVGRRDFWTRLIVSVICGVVFAPVLQNHFSWPDFPRLVLAASVACSATSWFAIGAGVRILKGMDKLPK